MTKIKNQLSYLTIAFLFIPGLLQARKLFSLNKSEEKKPLAMNSIIELGYNIGIGYMHGSCSDTLINNKEGIGLNYIASFSRKNNFSLGYGIGLNNYKGTNTLPLIIDMRLSTNKKSFNPFLFTNYGITVNWGKNINYTQRWGSEFMIGTGVKKIVAKNMQINLCFGYKRQITRYNYTNSASGTNIQAYCYGGHESYNYLVVKLGVIFS